MEEIQKNTTFDSGPPLPSNSPSNSIALGLWQKVILCLGVVALFVLATGTILSLRPLLKGNTQSSRQSVQNILPAKDNRPSVPVDATAEWGEYTNGRYNFSFKYPKDFLIRESESQYEYDIDINKGTDFQSLLSVQPVSFDNWPYYMHLEYQETVKINSIDWDVMTGQKVCDADVCLDIMIAYTTVHENYRYAFVLTDRKYEPRQGEILLTFKFSVNSNGQYFYVDETINPETKDLYFIRKENTESCGVNGAMFCDLVIRSKGGNESVITNLFFAESHKAINAKQGASLVAFSSPDVLLINFSGGEGAIGQGMIEEYDIKKGKLGRTILSYERSIGEKGVVKSLEDLKKVNFYEIKTDEGNLYFVNKASSKFAISGVYFEKDGKLAMVQFALSPPYDLQPNIKENFNYRRLKQFFIRMGGKRYVFDFKTGKFEETR